MNTIDIDSSLAKVVDCVREHNDRIGQALTAGHDVDGFDLATLYGAVAALLDAIDARTEAPALKAVA